MTAPSQDNAATFPTLSEVSLLQLSLLQRQLIGASGGTIPPVVYDDKGRAHNGFNSMALQEHPPEQPWLKAISSPISWAPSFITADVRKQRLDKGWSAGVTSGLAITTDALHQQLVNMGRKAKGLIDWKAMPDSIRTVVERISIPGSAQRPPVLSPETLHELTTAMDNLTEVPIKLQLGESKESEQTFLFKNAPTGLGKQSLLHTLVGLHTLSNGNVSRFNTTKEATSVAQPDRILLESTGAAEQAVQTLETVRTNLLEQLKEMQRTDVRLKGIDLEKMLQRQFDINREAFRKNLEEQADFLQVAGLMLRMKNFGVKYYDENRKEVMIDRAEPVAKCLRLIGRTLDEKPRLTNADQARRLIESIGYCTKEAIEPTLSESNKWNRMQARYRFDQARLEQANRKLAEQEPENSAAIILQPDTQKLLELAMAVAKKQNIAPLKLAVQVAQECAQEKLAPIEKGLRGPAHWLDRHIYDRRRKSSIVTALKEGYTDGQIAAAVEKAAEDYDGSGDFSKRIGQHLTPQNTTRR